MSDPYNSPPCIGNYDATSSDCYECGYSELCRIERNENRELSRRRYMPVKKNQHSYNSPTPQQYQQKVLNNSQQSVFEHGSFDPYEGESTFERFAKVLLLNLGGALGRTFSSFCSSFSWRPKGEDKNDVFDDE